MNVVHKEIHIRLTLNGRKIQKGYAEYPVLCGTHFVAHHTFNPNFVTCERCIKIMKKMRKKNESTTS